jgi:hypothetical protein
MVRGTDKPILGFGRMIYQMTPEAVDAQKRAGFPFVQGLEPTLRAMNTPGFTRSAASTCRPRHPCPASDLSPATLDETLARYGVTLPNGAICESAGEAAAAAEMIGSPVA